MRGKLRRALRHLHAKPIENRLESGTPDLAYIGGWLELKWLRGWPKQGGVVQLPHFTKAQRYWLRKHCEMGGRAFMILQVRREWFLFAGVHCDLPGQLTSQQLRLIAFESWPQFDSRGIAATITTPMEEFQRRCERISNHALPQLKPFLSFGAVGRRISTALQRDSE